MLYCGWWMSSLRLRLVYVGLASLIFFILAPTKGKPLAVCSPSSSTSWSRLLLPPRMTANTNMPRMSNTARMSNWTVKQDSTLVSIMRSKFDEGEWVNGSFTKNAWRTILEEFNQQTGLSVTPQQINHRWKNLKQQYMLLSNLRNKSGWGWDYDRECPIAPDEDAWNQLDIEHRRFRDRRWPHYEDMEVMVGRDVARGVEANSSQLRAAPVVEEEVVELGNDTPNHQSPAAVEDNNVSRGCKRSSTSGGSASKRGRRSLDGETAKQLRDIMQMQLSFQQQQARREFELEDLAKCTEVLRERDPMLGSIDYARVLLKLREPNFRDVFKMAQVDDAVFRQFIQMALQE